MSSPDASHPAQVSVAPASVVVLPSRSLSPVRQPAFWLALLAFALYIVPATSALKLSPDAVEHLDIARHLAAGQGYTLAIRAYHTGDRRVVHNGLDERAPLFPLLGAVLLKAGLGMYALQVLNAALAAGCAALVCALGSTLFGLRTGVSAGLLAAASPIVLMRMVPPMTEALSIFLILLAVWLLARDFEHPRPATFGAAGAALGLGYLARSTTAFLAVALLVTIVLASRNRAALRRPVLTLLVGLLAFVAPTVVYSLLVRGSPSYSGQSYLYAVFDNDDVMRNATLQPLPTPAEFISANRDFVLRAIRRQTENYARRLFLDRRWLLPLLPAWPLALLALLRGRYPRAAWLVLVLAASNYAIYALTWSTTFSERYILLTLLLLLPFAVDGLSRLGLASLSLPRARQLTALHLAAVVIAVFWSGTFVAEYRGRFEYGGQVVGSRVDRGVRWTGPPQWVEDRELARILDWVSASTGPDDVLAHRYPWPFTLFTSRPAVLLPIPLDPDTLRSFLVEYRVNYVLLDTRDQDRRHYVDDLDELEAAGVRAVRVGPYWVFETGPLWENLVRPS
jgi:hypothetical protein